MNLDSPLTELKGIGKVLAAKFAAAGLQTVADLIDYYPRRYDDYSKLTSVRRLKPGPVTIRAVFKQVKGRYVRRGMHVTEAVVSDETGSTRLIWFNQPYREAALKKGQPYFISGHYELSHQRFAIINPSAELVSDLPLNTARIVPVYRESKGLNSRQLRSALSQVLHLIETLPETLPASVLKEQGLISRAAALGNLHFPADAERLEQARHRVAFEEVFRLALASLLNKQANKFDEAIAIPFRADLARAFVGHLPFELTAAQRRAVWQIYQDIQQPQPMNRLIEGDVGSGKTVVAAMSALMALEQGWQVALMAPTELLARQHADTIYRLLIPLGYAESVTLLTGSLKAAQKKQAHQAIKQNQARFIIGTQALIQEKVDMHKLALVIIDEQHRFGVEQRQALQAKAGHMPHLLSLTATPIPRSLALTLYGELDISLLDKKPPGRKPVITRLVSPNSRRQVYDEIELQLEQGRQLFVVCPLISDSDGGSAFSAETVYETLRRGSFKHRRIGLMHGKLKPSEKQAVMELFVGHKLDILVSTTVIEVGVDVPNATVMLVEAAERFGLAQMHQLRGRVGRSRHQGYCYLMLSDSKPPGRRLRALESSDDGFRLSELDLEIRGPGAIYGTTQHGQLDLRIAKLTDTRLIAEARRSAQQFLATNPDLLKYKQLMSHVMRLRAVTHLD